MASQPPALRPEQLAAIQQQGHARQVMAASNAAVAEEAILAAAGDMTTLNTRATTIEQRLANAGIP